MSKNLFWIDLEMTGLDERHHCILEVGVAITDLEFNVLEEYQAVLKQPDSELAKMDNFVRNLHTTSGLLKLIPEGKPQAEVEKDLLALVAKYFPPDTKVVLAGNSVGNDKRFIDHHLREFAKRLHYRIIDISSYKEVFREKYGLKFEKKNAHRAIDDIHESMRELAFYLSFVTPPNTPPTRPM